MLGFIRITEPSWGISVTNYLHDLTNKHMLLTYLVPITADIFVFMYPIYLVVLYLGGLYYRQRDYKHLALLLFFSGFGSVFINYLIKFVLYKTRPIDDRSREDLILQYIPENSLPSDHAAMSSAIATVTIIYGLKNKDRRFLYGGIALGIISLVMSCSRIAIGAHWPTDIIVGTSIGVIVSCVFSTRKVYQRLLQSIFRPIMKFLDTIRYKITGFK